jgi:hypothetical protein
VHPWLAMPVASCVPHATRISLLCLRPDCGYRSRRTESPALERATLNGNVFPISNENNCDLCAFTVQIRATLGAVVESEAEMASCMHKGKGCSPKGTPLHKCNGYYECSFACENYVCENHAHKSRYGTFCAQCYPSPPALARPRAIHPNLPMAVVTANTAIRHAVARHR